MTNRFQEIKALDLPALERETLSWWDEHDIFARCLAARAQAPAFTFYEGPPTANGRPGIHHILGRTIKDVFCRYRTLKGFRVARKAGWDTHGLPVEIEVERELGLDGREQVEDYGISEFNDACRESVYRYKKDWDELTRRIAFWVDLDDPYVTFHASYIESVWWLIKRIYERGLLYRGHKIQWYSPGTGTVLSSHEVSLGYREITDPSVFVRFRSADVETRSLLAWTSTPWTLISNVALAVGPDIDYVEVRIRDERGASESLVLAEARLAVLQCEYEVLNRCKGRELAGERYVPLFRVGEEAHERNAWRVVMADYVSVDDGTGIVHIAPAFGAEDYAVGQREGLPVVNPMRPDGRFAEHTPLVAGMWFKDANKLINRDLRDRGAMYRQESYLHNYPHDWRKGTPLMSYPVESWFIRTTAVKDRLVTLNQRINWHPPAIRDGRFGNWLENNVDWALSRKRYWGTPLPIWVSDADGSEYFEVIGSIQELRDKCEQVLPADDAIDLHRPYVDQLTWPAPDGGTMRRVSDVLDVWFDSGAMPFAQWHYPFENEDAFEQSFPADFICEGLDQTRGWFYTLHAIATLVRDDVAFKNVVVNGLVLDEKGEKMSKTKGNSVDPFEVVSKHGADVVRWYMISNSPPWDNMKFAESGLLETRNKFFSTLENVYRFMASYANIDGFDHGEERLPLAGRAELDAWVLSRLNSTAGEVDDALDGYDCTRAARAIEQFVEEFSNWYVRRSRPRFWAAKKAAGSTRGVSDHDKLCAYQTTYECLLTVAKLMSPIAPLFGDWLYRSLNEVARLEPHPSVHMADFPVRDPRAVDAALEHRMALARTIVTLVLLLRNESRINVRQPLARIMLVTGGGVEREVIERVRTVILDEVNVREIEYIDDSSAIVTRSAKANFARLGPRLGKRMKAAAAKIAALDDSGLGALLRDGVVVLHLDDGDVDITADDVDIQSEAMGEWSVAQEGAVTVALDTNLSNELVSQGLAREVVNRIQKTRKACDFELTDRIVIAYAASERLAEAVEVHAGFICSETLAVEIKQVTQPAGEKIENFAIGRETLTVGIARIAR